MIDAGLRERVLRALREAALVDAPGAPPSSAAELRPLGGGLHPRSILAFAGERGFVVRVSDEPRAGTLELAVEASVTEEAAALGIAPHVVAAQTRGGVLITEHLAQARPLTPALLASPQNIQRVARLLKRLHSIRRPLRQYDAEAFADAYTRGLALRPEDRRRVAELRELARAYAVRFPSHVLCHNDLVASNVLDDGELKLVDFEYAVAAAPVLDIAGVAALNHFDDDGWQLASAYYGAAPVPFTPRELRRVVRLVRLVAYFWALSSSVRADERGPYAAFAERAAAALDDTKRS